MVLAALEGRPRKDAWRDAAITSQCLGPRSRSRCRINVAVRPRTSKDRVLSPYISTTRTAVWLRG